MNLYKDAENDIIDDLKDEENNHERKLKEYKYREEYFENEIEILSDENARFKRELENTKKEMIDAKETLQEI